MPMSLWRHSADSSAKLVGDRGRGDVLLKPGAGDPLADVKADLVLHWEFSQANPLTDVVGSLPMTYSATQTFTTDQNGVANGASVLDGTNGFNAYSAGLNTLLKWSSVPSYIGSITVWAYNTDWEKAADSVLFRFGGGGAALSMTEATGAVDQSITYFYDDNVNSFTTVATGVGPGAGSGWRQLVMTWSTSFIGLGDGTVAGFYDGAANTFSPVTGNNNIRNRDMSSVDCNIGRSFFGLTPWTGGISDFKIYKRALNSSEIALLIAAGL